MRFGTFFMDGFGIHRGRTFELDGQAPLVLFSGRNEAGKSTIMGFIRTMLFGFPTRARMAERYEPAGGGNHGGYLTLIDDRGNEIRLERYDKKGYPKLYYPDGREAGEAELSALLSGLTPELYRNLFAFSLSELHRLETLQGEDVSGFLYGSGTGVSGSAVVQAEKRLAANMDQLYRPRGQRQAINVKLKELETLEADIRKSKEQSSEFNERKRELDELEARIRELDERVKAYREEAEWLNKCAHARKPWLDIREIDREFAEAPERYRLTPAAEALLADRKELDHWLQKARERPRLRSEMAELKLQLDNERAAMEQLLRRIDPSWTIEEARRFPFSVIRQDELETFKRRFERLENGLSAARERLAALDAEGEQLALQADAEEARAAELERSMLAHVPAEAAADPDGFMAAVRQAWMQVKEDAADWSAAARKRAEALKTLQPLAKDDRREKGGKPGLAAFVLALAGGAAAVILLHLITRDPLVSFGAGAVVLLLGTATAMLANRPPKADPLAELRSTWSAILDEAEREEAAAAARARESRGRLLGRLSDLPHAAEAAAAGDRAGDPQDAVRALQSFIDGLEREMAGWKKRIGELDRARAARELAGKALEAWRMRRKREADHAARLEAQLADCRREWAEWLAMFKLPDHLRPEALKLMGEYAEQALEKADRIAKLEARLAGLAGEEETCRQAALGLLDKHGACLAEAAGRNGGGADNAGRSGPSGTGEEEPAAPSAAVEDWPERLNRLAVLADEFAAVKRRREEMEEKRRQQRRMLEEWMSEDRFSAMEQTLLDLDADQLAARLAEAGARTEEAEAELRALQEERGKRKGELERLLIGEEHAGLLLHGEAKEAELKQLAGQYAVQAMAALLIRKAREIHERERQPGVLRRASHYFSRITQGRYVKVLSPMGEKEILVETPDGQRLPSAMLSRGTAEQLYLAMRFALAEEYERIVSLPLVMDDIFVNFDGKRLKETLEVLAEVAGRRQILLFTCHDHVAEAVMAALPDSQRIDLPYSS